LLAKLVLEKYFRNDGVDVTERGDEHIFDNEVKAWLFPQLLDISKKWLSQCVVCQDNTFPQMLLLLSLAHDAADRIYRSIVSGAEGEARTILPILVPYNSEGSTKYVDFDTRRPVYATNKNKCHVSHVVCDTTMWEQKMAQTLEDMDNVVHYVKNSGLNFNIPYSFNGEQRNYVPDFIARIDDGHGGNDLLNVILEVTGEKRPDKEAKTATVRNLWVPAVNNGGQFGRWAFAEVRDPCNAKNEIKNQLKI